MNCGEDTIEIGLMEIFIGQMCHVLDRFGFLIASKRIQKFVDLQ